MSLNIITVAGAVLLSTLSMAVFAEEAIYTLEYFPSSPIKDLSLKNADLKLEIYKNDNPVGYQDIKTDANQNFKLDGNYDLEVVSIKGEEKFNARCSGSATTTNPKILINCTPKGNSKNKSMTEEIED